MTATPWGHRGWRSMGAHSLGLLHWCWSSGVTDPSCCRGGNESYSRPPWVGHVSLGSVWDWGPRLERVGAHRCAQPSWTATSLTRVNDPAATHPDQFCFGALSNTLHSGVWYTDPSGTDTACVIPQSLTRQNFCAYQLWSFLRASHCCQPPLQVDIRSCHGEPR